MSGSSNHEVKTVIPGEAANIEVTQDQFQYEVISRIVETFFRYPNFLAQSRAFGMTVTIDPKLRESILNSGCPGAEFVAANLV